MKTHVPERSPNRGPAAEAEIRQAVMRLLRLLAKEVALRLYELEAPERARRPRDE
jgi:hypothetical protein